MGDVIEGTIITSNTAAAGGGVYATDAAAVFLSDATLVNNMAEVRIALVHYI